MKKSKDRSALFAALLIGVALGAAASILYAPRGGRETRQAIKETSNRVSDNLGNTVADIKENIYDRFEKRRDGFGFMIGTAVARTFVLGKDIFHAVEKELKT